MTDAPDVRIYSAQARSTGTFGRTLCQARNHLLIVDGPVQNGCPGEEITPGEMFLAGVASCGVELIQVLARQEGPSPGEIRVEIEGKMDRSRPVRSDLTLFNSVRLRFFFQGITEQQARKLVEQFKGR